ncbi:MAG: hypothetical protein RI580_01815 [Halothece sp. Uz-M2-17]|mgnify:CR=1 FL=1|nr:hypothetical protein [Halothece sp. Uz-M2-17]
MSLEQLNKEISKLSPSERLTLVNLIIQSLQHELNYPDSNKEGLSTPKTGLIKKMRGYLQTDQATPTDADVKAMLEERRVKKYLR